MRLQFLGIDKRIRLHAVDRVRPDLTLEAFRYEHEIDGSRMAVYGEAVAAEVRLTVDAAGGTEKRPSSSGRSCIPRARLRSCR